MMAFSDSDLQVVGFKPSQKLCQRVTNRVPEWTELHYLATLGKVELLQDWIDKHSLLDLLAVINLRDDIASHTPLMVTIDLIDYVYDDFSAEDWEEFNNIQCDKTGSVEERLNFIDTLIKFGAEPEPILENGPSPLMVAATRDFVEAIYLLVRKHGANVNCVDKQFSCHTPLTEGIRSGSVRAVRALIELKADVNMEIRRWPDPYTGCRPYGYSPLHSAAIAIETQSLDVGVMPTVVEILLSSGADPYLQNEFGEYAVDLTTNMEFKNLVLYHRRKWFYIMLLHPECYSLDAVHFIISQYL
jgi:ankyrin repeat protein